MEELWGAHIHHMYASHLTHVCTHTHTHHTDTHTHTHTHRDTHTSHTDTQSHMFRSTAYCKLDGSVPVTAPPA